MAFQLNPTYTFSHFTSQKSAVFASVADEKATCTFELPRRGKVRYTSNGQRVVIRLPPSPTPSAPPWSLDTPEPDEDEDDDISFVGRESKHSSDEGEGDRLSGEDRDQSSDDENEMGNDAGDELSDDDGAESSDDGEEFDGENHTIPEEEIIALIREAALPIPVPHTAASLLSETLASDDSNNKDGKIIPCVDIPKEGDMAGETNGPSTDSTPTASQKPPLFMFGNTCPMATSASRSAQSKGSTLNLTTAQKSIFDFDLPETAPMSLSNSLLFNEVFKIREIDRKYHPCRNLDAQGAQCTSSVPRGHSLSIKLRVLSFGIAEGMTQMDVESLARYNMCEAHTEQSTTLANEWIRLALLTKDSRKRWQNQQKSLPPDSKLLSEIYAGRAVAEVRQILAQDKVAVWAKKEKTELYDEAQKTTTQPRPKVDSMESLDSVDRPKAPSEESLREYLDQICNLEKRIKTLTTENSSLKEAQKSNEDAVAKESERNHRALSAAKELDEKSQKAIEELRKEIITLTSEVTELTTENSHLKKGRVAAEDALDKEKTLGQQDLQDTKVLLDSSQRSGEALRKEVDTLTLRIGELTTNNSSLRKGQQLSEETLIQERKRGQQDLENIKELYEGSQRTIEALRKEAGDLNSCISELTTRESALQNSMASTQDALAKEKVRSRELEIRLEERVAQGIKIHNSSDSKLEKYLREELDKSQRHVLQQQRDFEKLRDEHVQLQITNATLDSQVKQIEAGKEELDRASKREFQELAERNSDLSNQLHYTRAQFEQLKSALVAMEKEKEIGGESSKSKFSLRDIYRRSKQEPSRLMTPPTDQ